MKKIISSILALTMLATNVVFATETNQNLEKATEVSQNIQAKYAEKTDEFWLEDADFWHYLGGVSLSNELKSDFIEVIFADVTDTEGKTSSELVHKYLRGLYSLSSLGFKTSILLSNRDDGTNVYDNVSPALELANLELNELRQGYFQTTAPFVVLALEEHNLDYNKTAYIDYMVSELPTTLESEWGPSVDSYAMILQGLVPFMTNSTVFGIVSEGITTLSDMQDENGSYGNANADAMVVILLSMLGINPDTDTRFVKNDNSLVDGLLSYVTAENDGFVGYTPDQWNDYATKQALVALNAYVSLENTGKAVNAYTLARDTAQNSMLDAQDFSVNFTFNVPGKTLIDLEVLAIDGVTAYDVIKVALENEGYSLVETYGYISGVTGEGLDLAELGAGANSGLLYRVNGTSPQVSASDYKLSANDVVNFYFTPDYTNDIDVTSFDDVSFTNWYYTSVDFSVYNGLFKGVSETSFGVNEHITHEMFLTVLHRLEAWSRGEEAEVLSTWSEASLKWADENGLLVTDVVKDALTREEMIEILYAFENGYAFLDNAFELAIQDGTILGRGDGTYGETDNVTRAEATTILMRYLNR